MQTLIINFSLNFISIYKLTALREYILLIGRFEYIYILLNIREKKMKKLKKIPLKIEVMSKSRETGCVYLRSK